jgi:Tfp pilus assembly protein FimT
MTMPEAMAALTISVLAITAAVPSASAGMRSWRLETAARTMAMEIHRARAEALARGRHAGIRFSRATGAWRWRLHVDGNADRSLTSAAIDAGDDPPIGPVIDLASRHPGVRFGIAGVAPVPRIPPAGGVLAASDDPIAFGSSDIFSASPTGEGSSGTIYLTDGQAMRAVVVAGSTGRVRVWRWDAVRGWSLP